MRTLLLRLVNGLMSLPYRGKPNISIGENTQVAYWRLRGRHGELRIGRDGMVHCRVDFDSPQGRVVIGDRCFIGASHIVAHTAVEIGDDVIISWGVTVVDHNSHSVHWLQRKNDVALWKKNQKDWTGVKVAPVKIGNKVWIGFGASILKGVQIGEGAVVGAHAVVTKDVAPYTTVAGNPAVVIQQLDQAP
jgi:acetyltransferase-like isoleucine patch superfamily enzyme